jgi:hypothetical protein
MRFMLDKRLSMTVEQAESAEQTEQAERGQID